MNLEIDKSELEKLYLNNTNRYCCSALQVTPKTLLRWIDKLGIPRKKDNPSAAFSLYWKVDGCWWKPEGFDPVTQNYFIAGEWRDIHKLESSSFPGGKN